MSFDLLDLWKASWKSTELERKEYDLSQASGWRVANAKRDPEDGDWWFTNGYKFFANWVQWREEQVNVWQIAKLPDGSPMVELDISCDINGVPVKMYLDRVMQHIETGIYAVVDIKTGKTTLKTGLQPAFYRYGLKKKYGIEANIGYYWMARKQELSEVIDLSPYTDDKIETLVDMFERARRDNIFLPNYDSCNRCGYSAHCVWKTTDNKGEANE
jgi:putative RecB family exonuclease